MTRSFRAAVLFALFASMIFPQVARSAPELGINLAGPNDWNTELPFVDVFRLSRVFSSQKTGAKWGEGAPLTFDASGWVTSIPPGCWAEAPMCSIEGGHFPAGEYTVTYDGRGVVEFWGGAARVVSSEPGRMRIDVDPRRGVFHIRIRETDPSDYVRNIRVVMPGFADSVAENPWHPTFLSRWKGVKCIRFMDFMMTNGSKISRWEERPTVEDATFTRCGVALETMIDLCNRLRADPWFCIPHLADDDFVRRFAEVVKARLDPGLRAYIEYSNEVWNSGFPQHRYAAARGAELGLTSKPGEAVWVFTAWRSVQIFRIFEETFGGRDRFVRVLPAQSGNLYMTRTLLDFQGASKQADVLAIAPYFGMSVPQQPNKWSPIPAAEVAAWGVDRLFNHLETVVVPEVNIRMQEAAKLAGQRGLTLVAYEGGQHLVGIQGGENDKALNALFRTANLDPRMGELYSENLRGWESAGGALFCHFSSVARWSKSGFWGLLQSYDEDPASSPKLQALLKWAQLPESRDSPVHD